MNTPFQAKILSCYLTSTDGSRRIPPRWWWYMHKRSYWYWDFSVIQHRGYFDLLGTFQGLVILEYPTGPNRSTSFCMLTQRRMLCRLPSRGYDPLGRRKMETNASLGYEWAMWLSFVWTPNMEWIILPSTFMFYILRAGKALHDIEKTHPDICRLSMTWLSIQSTKKTPALFAKNIAQMNFVLFPVQKHRRLTFLKVPIIIWIQHKEYTRAQYYSQKFCNNETSDLSTIKLEAMEEQAVCSDEGSTIYLAATLAWSTAAMPRLQKVQAFNVQKISGVTLATIKVIFQRTAIGLSWTWRRKLRKPWPICLGERSLQWNVACGCVGILLCSWGVTQNEDVQQNLSKNKTDNSAKPDPELRVR